MKFADYKPNENLLRPWEMYNRRDIALRNCAAFDEVYAWAQKEKFTNAPIKHSVKTIALDRRIVTDEEYAYGPDGGYSVREISFDRENTLNVMEMLWQPPQNPFTILAKTMTYRDRTQPFRDACTERGIHFENRLFW